MNVEDTYKIVLEDGIIQISYLVSKVSLEIGSQIAIQANQFIESVVTPTIPILVDFSKLVAVDEEMLLIQAQSAENNQYLSAAAFLLTNQINKIIFKVYDQFEPVIPVKGFTDKSEAIAWLKQMHQEHQKRLNARSGYISE